MNDSNLPVRRLYRSQTDRMVAGVAGGLAEYAKVDPVWIRVLFVALTVFTGGVFLLVYLAAWILVPENPTTLVPPTRATPRLHRSSTDRMAGGVCGGLAETFKVDPSLVRLATVAAIVFTGGAALLAYLVAWIVLPLEPAPLPPAATSETPTEPPSETTPALTTGGLHEPPVEATSRSVEEP